MRTLNLGILAHVDAGKTSLTERLLYAAGVIDEIGRVDDGNTQTDSLALERQRGITIKSAVVSFEIDGVTVNLIDTPGHPDFIAEVERVLGVLDGAVLVVSAVEGVQSQTRILMRTLLRLGVPTLIFVNKIDRGGARPETVLNTITEQLSDAAVPMGWVERPGTRTATFTAFAPAADPDLADRSRQAKAHPVFFGSAITGAGVPDLFGSLPTLLPAGAGDPAADLAGVVFKIERSAAGERIVYARLFAGTVQARERVPFGPPGTATLARAAKITKLAAFGSGTAKPAEAAVAGQIVKLWGLNEARIADVIGRPAPGLPSGFARPTLETVVTPECPAAATQLNLALSQLAEQDPLINFHRGPDAELAVSLYGEVQKEVIGATLADDFGVPVRFRESTVLCIERLRGDGEAVEVIGADDNPFFATVGLRIEPGAPDSGLAYAVASDRRGTMPLAFFTAVQETVADALGQGLRGWPVTDCRVTLTHTGYWPRQSHSHAVFDKSMSSTAGDFRLLTPLVLMAALRQAGTVVAEPMHRFRLEVPADTVSVVLPALERLGAIPQPPTVEGSAYVIVGDIPAAQVHALTMKLPTLTRGEGLLESTFDHYRRVRGAPPARPRTLPDPLDRTGYLQRVQR